MRLLRALFLCGAALTAARGADDVFDRLDDALTVSGLHDQLRARVSGTLDAEGYTFGGTAPGLIYTSGHSLFTPRLTLFLDAQLGGKVYLFVQTRTDRGFDPAEGGLRTRLDEYALRVTPWDDGRLSVQAGKFATLVGNWAPRHGSWENPFITAPLPYENLSGIWDGVAARSVGTLLFWSHMKPFPFPFNEYADKHMRTPVIWGPNYATGAAVSGRAGAFSYGAEVKNAPLSSRPDAWGDDGAQWRYPTVSGRLGWSPDPRWNFGLSASDGPYLRPVAEPTLPAGYTRADYRQHVLGQDASFAWHHWQVWAEAYEARFTIPRVGDVRTTTYYTELKYKFTPQFSGAVRWNQQFHSTVMDPVAGPMRWGRDLWRIDFAPGYRFTAHVQLKLQYSLQHEDRAAEKYEHIGAAQLTLRF